MVTSLFFVAANLIEFAFVLHLHQYNEKCMMKQQLIRQWKRKMDNLTETEKTIKPKYNIQKIDRVAFAVGGLLFLLFNVLYWFLAFNIN